MLTTLRGPKSKKTAGTGASRQSAMLLAFSVGGRRMAARAKDVSGIWPWGQPVPVPSTTPYVTALIRHGDEILAVFDLAARLNVQVRGQVPLCLIAKRRDGLVAVCIDGEVPALHMVNEDAIRPVSWKDSDVVGTCRIGSEEVPVYSLAQLGLVSQSLP